MKIALYGKVFKQEHKEPLQLLFDELSRHGASVCIFEAFVEKIKNELHLPEVYNTFSKHDDITENIDFLFSIGGDGTLLDTIRFIRDSGIPILGINLGRMGFLSSINKNKISDTIQKVSKGKYQIEARALLHLESPKGLFGDLNYALNEISVIRNASEGMLTIKVCVNGDLLNTYWGDGLIVATPTGSTAYSLSNNGPIILPGSKNFVITPVATHNLTVRPIVIPDNDEIRIKIEGRCTNYVVGLDSGSVESNSDMELVIRKESFAINLLQMQGEHFFKTIRKKLMWGLDIRN